MLNECNKCDRVFQIQKKMCELVRENTKLSNDNQELSDKVKLQYTGQKNEK